MATDGQGGGDNSTGDWVDGVPAVAAPNPMAPTVAEPEVTDARHEAAMEADRAAFELLRQSLGMTAEDGFEAVVLRAAEVVSARTSAATASTPTRASARCASGTAVGCPATTGTS